jgi:hypothetical protein
MCIYQGCIFVTDGNVRMEKRSCELYGNASQCDIECFSMKVNTQRFSHSLRDKMRKQRKEGKE